MSGRATINPSPWVFEPWRLPLKFNAITFKRRVLLAKTMVHVLETGLEYMDIDNFQGMFYC